MTTIQWLYRTFRDFLSRNQHNAVEAYSAQASLFVVISFFPFTVFALALLPYLPFSQSQITGAFLEIVPNAIADYAARLIREMYGTTSIPVLSIAALLAIWSASKGSIAVMRGLDRIYGVRRRRGYLVVRLMASVYVLVFFVLLIVILVFLGFGSVVFTWLSSRIPVLKTSLFLKGSIRVLVSLIVLFLLFWLIYLSIPKHHTGLLREAPGALVAAVGWVGFSFLYSVYLDNIGGISLYYGSLSLIMFSFLWLYFCMYIIFVGAEVNVWLYENWSSLRHDRARRHN